MNRGLVLLTLVLLSFTGTLFAKKKKSFPELRTIIPMTELSSEMIDQVIHGKLPHVAIECQPGMEFFPKLSLNYGLLSTLFNPVALLKINRSFYFRFNGKKPYV